MAFRINGIDVITNERSLDDVNKAGITTALLVGPEGAETFQVDGITGIATAAKFVLSGDATTQIDAFITETDLTGASDSNVPTTLAIKTYVDNSLQSGGTLEGTNLDLSGYISVGTTATFEGAVEFESTIKFGDAGQTVDTIGVSTALTEGGSASNTVLPTELAVKTYVDSVVNSNNQLMFLGDGAEEGLIDLASEKITYKGTEFQIETAVDAAEGNELTFKLADETKIVTSLIVGETLGASGGDLIAASATAAAGGIGVAINCDLNVTGNVDSASDRKLKENIEVIPGALEKVAALRGVEYTWKATGNYSAGIIAQEVQAVMPGLVTENDNHLSVQYNGLIGLLIEGMKEQQAQIEELKSRLA